MMIRYVVYFVLALLLSSLITWFCVKSGIDWQVAAYFERNPTFIYAAIPGVLAGMVVPLIIIGFYFAKGKKHNNATDIKIARKLSIGFLTSFLISTLLKSLTNRVDMEPFEPLGFVDFSNQFRWGFLNSNNLWESLSEGWPSGHTFIATTFVVMLYATLSKIKNQFHLLYLLIIMLSVVTAFHWLSDIISGFILGFAMGKIFQIKRHENR